MRTSTLTVALISVASSVTAYGGDTMNNGAFTYGAGHGSFAAHSGHDHKHG